MGGYGKNELDEGRPLIYKGYTEDLGAGHAFVINGYDEDYFHLNWGWSGSYNGWYLISNLSPGGYNFSTWQGAIINLYPEIEQIFGCTDTLMLVIIMKMQILMIVHVNMC